MGLFDKFKKKDYRTFKCNEYAKEFKKLYEELVKVQTVDEKSIREINSLFGHAELHRIFEKQEVILKQMEELCGYWERRCISDQNAIFANYILYHNDNIFIEAKGEDLRPVDESLAQWFGKIANEHLVRGGSSRGRYVIRNPDGTITTWNASAYE